MKPETDRRRARDRGARVARMGTRILAWTVIVASLVPVCGVGRGVAVGAEPVLLRVGVAKDILLDVSRKDAQVAFDVWLKELAKEERGVSEMRSVFLDDPAAVAAAIQQNDVDLVLLPTLDFLHLQQQVALEAVRVGIAARTGLDVELLLVHRDRVPGGFRELSGQRLMVQPGAVGSLSRLWLDVLFARQGFPESGQVFGEVRQGLRASQVVLPVFFRQAEAAVVKEASYVTVGDMNPQVAKQVVALARSPGLVHGVVCLNAKISAEPRRLLMDGMQRMTTSAAGRQILTLFRINQLPLFDASHLAHVTAMVQERAALRNGRRL